MVYTLTEEPRRRKRKTDEPKQIEKPQKQDDGFRENNRLSGILAAGIFAAACVFVDRSEINVELELPGSNKLQIRKKRKGEPQYRMVSK